MRSTGETPFSMTYGTEAVIPVEISLLSPKVACFEQGSNNEGLVGSLDMLEEQREMESVWLADYQHILAQRYNRNVRPRERGQASTELERSLPSDCYGRSRHV